MCTVLSTVLLCCSLLVRFEWRVYRIIDIISTRVVSPQCSVSGESGCCMVVITVDQFGGHYVAPTVNGKQSYLIS